MTLLLSASPSMSMTPAHKATINTISCLAASHAIFVDYETSEIVKFQQHFHKDLQLPIYSSPIAPLLGAISIAACATNNPITGLMVAQQSVQCAYIRRSLVNTAVKNLIDNKKAKARTDNQISTWIAPTTK